MDLLFALIIITIAIGLSADALDAVNFKISDYAAGKSLDRIATDTTAILINTPGTPCWEKSNSTDSVIPGLAMDNNGSKNTTKILSFAKISQLTINYQQLMGNVIPPGTNSSLTIYPSKPSLEPLKVGNETPPPDATEVAVVNRTVLVNFADFRILASLISNSYPEVCPHNNFTGGHGRVNHNSTTCWNCRNFKVTQEDLNSTDFYIITDPILLKDNKARWLLDRPDNMSDELGTFQGQPLLVNDKIHVMLGDDEETVLWLHIQTSDGPLSFNTYLVGVPKGTSSNDVSIEYLHPQTCSFVFKIWME